MKKLSKFFLSGIIFSFIFSGVFFLNSWEQVYAWDTSISLIPGEDLWWSCEWFLAWFSSKMDDKMSAWEFSFDSFWCYFVYLIDVFTKLSVMISFLFVLIWAFRYTVTYLEWDDDWKSAKTTIKNALIWLAVSSLAYVIIDIFIRFLL